MSLGLLFPHIADDLRRIAGDDSEIRDVAGDDRSRRNQCMPADRDAAEDGRIGADRRTLAHQCCFGLPILRTLEAAVGVDRRRIAVVGEAGMRTDKDTVLDGDAFGIKAKAWILQRAPIFTPLRISTKAPTFVSSPSSQP